MDDDWLEEFNKPKPKPMELRPQERTLPPPEPVKEIVLREPPPSLIHTNSQTHYVLLNTDIHMVLKLPEWAIERLNFLFLSKAYVVVIATDPSARVTGANRVSGYGVMRAMGRREVEVSWLRVWGVSAEELRIKNLVSAELHRSLICSSMYEETSSLHGRNICRYMDKLVFNSVETDYLNERELIFKGKRARLNKRFQNHAEVKLVNASYDEYCKLYEESTQTSEGGACDQNVVPSLRVISL